MNKMCIEKKEKEFSMIDIVDSRWSEASSLSIASRTFRGVDMVVCLWVYGVIVTVIVFVID